MVYTAVINIPKTHKIDYAKKLRQQYHTSRSKIAITETENMIRIKLEARDIVALMASCSSVLKETKLINDIASISLSSAKKYKK
ncbi:MAG: hypothetical protein M1465_01495 [Candidatus Marsarchaeota archaeon]|nr:hypothetical protein [Candidatus Marsarchaeota archaeon]